MPDYTPRSLFPSLRVYIYIYIYIYIYNIPYFLRASSARFVDGAGVRGRGGGEGRRGEGRVVRGGGVVEGGGR